MRNLRAIGAVMLVIGASWAGSTKPAPDTLPYRGTAAGGGDPTVKDLLALWASIGRESQTSCSMRLPRAVFQ